MKSGGGEIEFENNCLKENKTEKWKKIYFCRLSGVILLLDYLSEMFSLYLKLQFQRKDHT